MNGTSCFDFWNLTAIATYIYRTAGFQPDAAFLNGILVSKFDGELVSVGSRRICQNRIVSG
ncbi:MAG: hypothetical protein LH614_11140 [Pyrinomonadaceae bacterium]|nr:hypothetical protein [Pyrinomonadaceae bacterium]